MNRQQADRIIVKSNSRMQMVLDWYFENKSWLDKAEFHAPLESGIIELREEQIKVTFENKGNVVELSIVPMLKPNLPPIVIFDYDPQTWMASNYRFAPHLPKAKQDALQLVIQFDNTDKKEALKYHTLTLFMTYYQEIITVDERRAFETKNGKKNQKKGSQKPKPVIRKFYSIQSFDKDALPKPEGVKRPYTKPEHEVNVRGFLRRYKSGKTVWIKPSVRYKGKETTNKEYEL